MHSIQGAKASIARWRAVWHRAKEMPGMRFIYRMEGFAVPLLPLQIENQTAQSRIQEKDSSCHERRGRKYRDEEDEKGRTTAGNPKN
jgi:hypothetical protein